MMRIEKRKKSYDAI